MGKNLLIYRMAITTNKRSKQTLCKTKSIQYYWINNHISVVSLNGTKKIDWVLIGVKRTIIGKRFQNWCGKLFLSQTNRLGTGHKWFRRRRNRKWVVSKNLSIKIKSQLYKKKFLKKSNWNLLVKKWFEDQNDAIWWYNMGISMFFVYMYVLFMFNQY